MRRAIVRVGISHLVEALHLPADTEIINAQFNLDRNTIDLMVCHPDLRDIANNAIADQINPLFKTTYCHTELTSWGQR